MPYNPIFEQLVDTAEGQHGYLNGLVAYGLYKIAKREWSKEIQERTGNPPTREDLIAYTRTWTPAMINNVRSEARTVLATYASEVIEDARPGIREDAIRGTNWRAIGLNLAAAALYSLILLALVLIATWFGVDLIGLFQKARPAG